MRSEINDVAGFRFLISFENFEKILFILNSHWPPNFPPSTLIWSPWVLNPPCILGSRIILNQDLTLYEVLHKCSETFQSFWGCTRMTLGESRLDGRGGWIPTQPCSNLLGHHQTAEQKVKGSEYFSLLIFGNTWQLYTFLKSIFWRRRQKVYFVCYSQEWSLPHWSSTSASSPYHRCK